MITTITKNIWQFSFSPLQTCIYLLKHDNKNIIIDTGAIIDRPRLKNSLKELNLSPEKIDIVLLTHRHFDHTGNISIFKNAKIYGSTKDFSDEKILDITELKIPGIKIIETPGHTKGGVCFYLKEEKILFSGDIIFHKGMIGRVDFEDSSPKDMEESIEKLQDLEVKILCPGHSY